MTSNELFDSVFDSLQESLASIKTFYPAQTGETVPIIQNHVDSKLRPLVLKQMKHQANTSFREIQEIRNGAFEGLGNVLMSKHASISQISELKKMLLLLCKRQNMAIDKRMGNQQAAAERRLRELIFEIIGEYGKSTVRVCRRQQYLKSSGRIKVMLAAWRLNWERFCHRFAYDICKHPNYASSSAATRNVFCRPLRFEEDAVEIAHVLAVVMKRLESSFEQRFRVTSIVRVSKTVHSKPFSAQSPPLLAKGSGKDINAFVSLLAIWAKKSGGKSSAPSGSSRVPKPPTPAPLLSLDTLLRTECIECYHPSSFSPAHMDRVTAFQIGDVMELATVHTSAHPEYANHYSGAQLDAMSLDISQFASRYANQHRSSLFNNRLYFCLEERFFAMSSMSHTTSNNKKGRKSENEEKSDAMLNLFTMLQIVYAPKDERWAKFLSNPHLASISLRESLSAAVVLETKNSRCGTHRNLSVTDIEHLVSHSGQFFSKAKDDANIVTQLHYSLSGFPDVIQAEAIEADGRSSLLHFAPAILLNLAETAQFAQDCLQFSQDSVKFNANNTRAGFGNDEIVQFATSVCPHPFMSSIMSKPMKEAPLGNLYCLSLTAAMANDSILRTENAVSLSSEVTAQRRDEQILSLIPLSEVCMREITATYIWKVGGAGVPTAPPAIQARFNGSGGESESSAATEEEENVTASSSSSSGVYKYKRRGDECFTLLPDHARVRDKTGTGMFNYDYALIADQNSFVSQPQQDGHNDNNVSRGGGNSNSNSNIDTTNSGGQALPCYYFLQVFEEPGWVSTAVVGAGAGTSSRSNKGKTSIKSNKLENSINTEDLPSTQRDSGAVPPPAISPRSSPRTSKYRSTMSKSIREEGDSSLVIDESSGKIGSSITNNFSSLGSLGPIVRPSPRCAVSKEALTYKKPPVAHDFEDLLLRSIILREFKNVMEYAKGKGLIATSSSTTQADDDTGDGNEASGASKSGSNSKRKWDPNVLSTVCRWRSCLCDAIPASYRVPSKYKFLCAYHMELKEFLDEKMNGGVDKTGAESAKYLPKKAPNFGTSASGSTIKDGKKDLLTIRAASTLLQELWDGKLKTTVKQFANKINRDMTLRVFLEQALATSKSSASSAAAVKKKLRQAEKAAAIARRKKSTSHASAVKDAVVAAEIAAQAAAKAAELNAANPSVLDDVELPDPPAWIVWRDSDFLERTLYGQESSINLLSVILQTERNITAEVEQLAELKVYPSAELTIIRKEVKAFKEQQEAMLQQPTDGAAHHMTPSSSKVELAAAAAAGDEDAAAELAAAAASTNGYDDLMDILNLENKLCVRKIHILSARRVEEEEYRMKQLRKQAKLRAMEEDQAADKSNFGHQHGRF